MSAWRKITRAFSFVAFSFAMASASGLMSMAETSANRNAIASEMANEILVAENVIVGPIPDSYYNLEGLETKDAMEVVE